MDYKTREEIADEFGVCPKTFRAKLKAAEIKLPRGRVTPRYQKMIYELLWYPDGVDSEDYEKIKLPQSHEEG